jgi:hypothetical protein
MLLHGDLRNNAQILFEVRILRPCLLPLPVRAIAKPVPMKRIGTKPIHRRDQFLPVAIRQPSVTVLNYFG